MRDQFGWPPLCMLSITRSLYCESETGITNWQFQVKRRFLEDVSIPWVQQVAVMFEIVGALVLDVLEAAASLDKFQGVSPNVLLAYEPCP